MLQPVNVNEKSRKKRKRSPSSALNSTSKRKCSTSSQILDEIRLSENEPNFEFLSCGGNIQSFLELEFDAEKHERNIPTNWFENQPNIRPSFRRRLFEWLFQVHVKFTLEDSTLFLAASIFDRYMGKVKVERKNLQMVGSTCLWMASKYHDIRPLGASQLARLAAGAFQDRHVIKEERKICVKLDFNLTVPCPLVFLSRFLIDLRHEEHIVYIRKCCMFILQFILLDSSYVGTKPSWQATLALYFTLLTFKKNYSKKWEKLCGYDAKSLQLESKNLYKKFIELQSDDKLLRKHAKMCKLLRGSRVKKLFT